MRLRDPVPHRPWVRPAYGVLLLLHALAHALPGMRITDVTRWDAAGSGVLLWIATVLWAAAMVGLAAGGLGLLGARAFRSRWRWLVLLGILTSAVLLATLWRSPWAVAGLLIDAGLFALLLRGRVAGEAGSATEAQPLPDRQPGHSRRVLGHLGSAAAAAFVLCLAAAILLRPWHMRWGSTEAELRAALPGDEAGATPTYQIQHAVAIRAAPEEIWPWLVQIGHDRGGFYSYSWLENRFGLSVRNAERIHSEWQSLAAGDSVLATPDDYLRLGRRFGWRVGQVDPNRLLVLETWGAFVLEPVDAGTTRLIVRTRGAGGESLSGIALAPLGLLVFEPAHFVMQRRMLLGIRDRVERTGGSGASATPGVGRARHP